MILEDLLNGLLELFCNLLYRLFSGICILIDFIKTIFFKLCGIETVEINGTQTDLLSNLLESEIIKRAFLIIFIIGFILLIIFTMLAIIKSNYQEKQNWKTVLTKTMHGFFIMLLIPATVMAGILLTNTIMSSINQAMQVYPSNGQASIGGQFLVTIGYDAYKGIENKSVIESMFCSGELSYSNLSLVKQYYNVTELNFVIGLLGSLVMLIMFVISSLTFVQRIFDIVLLYIISPVSISTIPLDEGNRFKVWKDMLISKVLSAYGIILVMNLFFLIIPQVYQIKFFDSNFNNGVVYILFLIGGSFAVTKASRVISQLCGSSATGGEMAQMIYNIRSGIALTKASTALVGGAVGGLIGGSDYKDSRKKGKSRGESFISSLRSTRNQHVVKDGEKKNKVKQVVGAPFRLATLPFGMLKDLSKGGLIQVGKNFIPRLRNVISGDSILNRADVKKKPKNKKDKSNRTKTDTNSGGGYADDSGKKDNSETNTNIDREVESILKDDGKPASDEESNREFSGPSLKDEDSDEGGNDKK